MEEDRKPSHTARKVLARPLMDAGVARDAETPSVFSGIQAHLLYDGWIKLYVLDLGSFRGADEEASEREVAVIRPGVVIVPVLDDGRIAVVTQRRHAVGGDRCELPAGMVDGNEPPLEAAARELREEAGLDAGNIEIVATWDVSPGSTTEQVHLALARNCRRSGDARLRTEFLTLEEFLGRVRDGRIRHATSVAAVLWCHALGLLAGIPS